MPLLSSLLRISFACFFFLLPPAGFGQDDHARQVDTIFQPWSDPAGPGAAVAVIQEGRLVLARGFGSADLEHGVPIGPDTIFHVASVSKQFTAMALVLLEQDGKLSIDDNVRKYLPELPDYGHPITIRNLLQHTSGIRDQWQTLALAGWSMEDVFTQDQILRMLFHQKELNFPPGTDQLYSNSGYTLAAEIVARVSGQTFPGFCADRIFKPLGMAHSHFHQDLHEIVMNRAESYSGLKGAYQAAPLNFATVGATSLFTTAPDLTRWLDNFREPAVGGRGAIKRLTEETTLSDGRKISYALGLRIGKHRGLATIYHLGEDAGFRAYVRWYPDQRLGIAVLSNLATFNPDAITDRVAAVYIGSQMTPEPPPVKRTYVNVDPATLQTYAGRYPLPQIGQPLVAVVEKGKLFAAGPVQPPLEMKATGPATFYVEPLAAEVEFRPALHGGMKVIVRQPGAVNEGVRVIEQTGTPPDLRRYAGTYWSEELETQYTLSVVDGKLIATHVRHGVIALTPTAPDCFNSDQWFMPNVTFVHGKNGQVTAVKLGGGRVREITFVRK